MTNILTDRPKFKAEEVQPWISFSFMPHKRIRSIRVIFLLNLLRTPSPRIILLEWANIRSLIIYLKAGSFNAQQTVPSPLYYWEGKQ